MSQRKPLRLLQGNADVGGKAHTTVAENATAIGDGDVTSAKEWGGQPSLTVIKRPIRT